MDDIVIKKSIHVKMDKNTLLKACTELVTVNGRPFTIFSDSGIKKILDPLTQAIGEGNCLILIQGVIYFKINPINTYFLLNILGFTINSHNIKSHILSASAMIIDKIKSDIVNELISLKIDCVKRHSRSIMGVNVQYIKDNELCLYSIAMVEINQQHTAENLKKLVNVIIKTLKV